MAIRTERAAGKPRSWTWEELRALPTEEVTADIHGETNCSIETLMRDVDTDARFVLAHSYGGYSSNLPIEDATGGKACIAFAFDGKPLALEHGGPARLLVPHLYFWKSAKWVRGLELRDTDKPGFWETFSYHNQGDPWREQRHAGD